MIQSSNLGDWIGRRKAAKKVYPEKLCAFCGEPFTPKNAAAAKTRYFCYDWKCEENVDRQRKKMARQRQKAKKARRAN